MPHIVKKGVTDTLARHLQKGRLPEVEGHTPSTDENAEKSYESDYDYTVTGKPMRGYAVPRRDKGTQKRLKPESRRGRDSTDGEPQTPAPQKTTGQRAASGPDENALFSTLGSKNKSY